MMPLDVDARPAFGYRGLVRAVVQRVSEARVRVDGETVGEIGRGLLVLLGIRRDEADGTARSMAEKIAGLRIFDDAEGRMDLSVQESGGGVLVVSQFTLYGDARKGRRPSYIEAAAGEFAEARYGAVCAELRRLGLPVATGRFGAMMAVEMVGDGPVTILLDSDRRF
jgi:D-tyrosyl-tRNA(Tyr) deacylase